MTSGLYIYQLWVKNELLLCYALLSKCVTCLADSRLPVCECLCHIEMVLYCFIIEPKTVVEIAMKQWSYLFQKEIRPGKMESTEFCLINEINLWVLTNCPTSTIHLKPITFPPSWNHETGRTTFFFNGRVLYILGNSQSTIKFILTFFCHLGYIFHLNMVSEITSVTFLMNLKEAALSVYGTFIIKPKHLSVHWCNWQFTYTLELFIDVDGVSPHCASWSTEVWS